MDQVYNGARYEAMEAPGGQVRGQFVHNVLGDMMAAGRQQVANNLGALGKVLVDRYEFLNDARQDAELQELDSQFNAELDEKMALPNGDPDGFFDESGQLNTEALNQFVGGHVRAVNDIRDGSVVPMNREKRALYREQYLAKLSDKVTASALSSVSKRSEKAFHDMYNNYMAREDYGSAAALAERAFGDHIMSRAEADTYALRARKGALRGAVRGRAASVGARQMADDMVTALSDDVVKGLAEEKVAEGGEKVAEEPKAGEDITLSAEYREPLRRSIFPEGDVKGDDLTLRAGINELSADEFSALWQDVSLRAGQQRMGGDGVIEVNESAPEAAQVYAYAANEAGGMSVEDYRRMGYAVMGKLADEAAYAGLSDAELQDVFLKAVDIEGIEEDMFAGELDPAAAKRSLLKGVAQNVISTRKDKVRRTVEDFIKGNAELNARAQEWDAEMAALYEGSEAMVKLGAAKESWFSQEKSQAAYGDIRPLYEKYERQFLAENPSRAGKKPWDNVDEFKGWYLKRGKAYKAELEGFKRSAADYVTMRCTDALVDYRLGGGSDWGEEQRVIAETAQQALRDFRGGGEYEAYRKRRDEDMRTRAAEVAVGYESAMERLRPVQKRYAERAAERKAAEEKRKAEEKAANKRREEAAERKANPYRYDMRVGMRARGDGESVKTLTVPEGEYEAMRAQLGCEVGEGVVCTLNGGSVPILVKPGKVDGMYMNTATLNYVLGGGKKVDKKLARAAVNGAMQRVKFKRAN